MIKGLKPYAEYKESGIPWAGGVPAHWNIHLIRQIGLLLKGSGGSKADNVDEGLPCVRYGQLYTKYRGFINAPKSFIRHSQAAQYTAIQYGDVLFAASGEKVDEIGKSAVNLMRTAAVCGGDVIILRPRMDAYPPFLGYALDSYASAGQKATMCRGSTIKHVYPDELRLLAVSFPPPDEQTAIVRFLDHANRKIDGFIRVKRKLIRLLNEQKQAIVHRAVTRGLHPDVPLKPSGIPWLGDIPKHWDVLRAKYVFREVDERSKTGNEEQLSVSHLTGVTPRSQKNVSMFKAESYVGHKVCRPGDLAVNTMWAWMAALGVSKHLGIISPAYAVYRQRTPERLLPDFADHLLRISSYKLNYLSRSTGLRASRLRLYPDEFFEIPIIIPQKEEQQQIVDSITVETAALTTAMARTEREIALMQEYRTRLTADLVTGKLDVREASGHLPALPSDTSTEPHVDEALEDLATEDVDA